VLGGLLENLLQTGKLSKVKSEYRNGRSRSRKKGRKVENPCENKTKVRSAKMEREQSEWNALVFYTCFQ